MLMRVAPVSRAARVKGGTISWRMTVATSHGGLASLDLVTLTFCPPLVRRGGEPRAEPGVPPFSTRAWTSCGRGLRSEMSLAFERERPRSRRHRERTRPAGLSHGSRPRSRSRRSPEAERLWMLDVDPLEGPGSPTPSVRCSPPQRRQPRMNSCPARPRRTGQRAPDRPGPCGPGRSPLPGPRALGSWPVPLVLILSTSTSTIVHQEGLVTDRGMEGVWRRWKQQIGPGGARPPRAALPPARRVRRRASALPRSRRT